MKQQLSVEFCCPGALAHIQVGRNLAGWNHAGGPYPDRWTGMVPLVSPRACHGLNMPAHLIGCAALF